MDFQLYGADGVEIIPLRVDHHEAIWDVDLFYEWRGAGITKPEDRTLIASAPDLLEALEAMDSYFHSGNAVPVERATIKADSEAVRIMKAAIAKARGEAND